MATVQLDAELVQDLLRRRDALVGSITAGMTSGNWDPVMRAFDDLLAALARLEESVARAEHG